MKIFSFETPNPKSNYIFQNLKAKSMNNYKGGTFSPQKGGNLINK